MDWKKVGLFVLFLISGIFLFILITGLTGYLSWFLPLFLLLLILFLILILRDYTKKKLIVIISLFIIYILIQVIPFPICDADYTSCTCLGIKKYLPSSLFRPITSISIVEKSTPSTIIGQKILTQCVGIPTNHKTINIVNYLKPTLSAENPFEIDEEVKISKVKGSKQSAYVFVFNKLDKNINVELKLVKCVYIDGKELDTSAIDFIASPTTIIEPDKQQEFKVLFKATNNLNKGTYICIIGAFDTNIDAIYQEKQFFLNVAD